MNNDLKNLLQQSASDAPAERHGVQDIVTRARRHQRRHSAGVWGGSALALALIVGGGYALLDGPGSDQSQPVTTEEKDITIDLTKARDAVEGKDYELISELEGQGVPDFGWSPDDVIPVAVGSGYRFVRGSDGTVVATLEVPTGYDFPWFSGQGVVVWGAAQGELIPLVQDLSGGDPYEVPISLDMVEDLDVEVARVLTVDAGRLWVSIPLEGFKENPELGVVTASAPLDGSDDFRREIEGTLLFPPVFGDGHMAWTAGLGEPLMVRDLESGKDREVAVPNSKDCTYSITGVTAQRVSAEQQCFKPDTSIDEEGFNNSTVFSLTGAPDVVLRNAFSPPGGLSDKALMFTRPGDEEAQNAPKESGDGMAIATYIYQFDTGELLDLGAIRNSFRGFEEQFAHLAGGDQVIYPSPDTKGKLSLITLK